MVNKVSTATVIGLKAYEVTVETDVMNGLPAFSIVGLPDVAITEARERVRSAIKNSGYSFPNQKGKKISELENQIKIYKDKLKTQIRLFNINSSTNNQIELMTKTFLELSESNQYILLGKAMELLKEESITTSTSSTSNEKGA